MDHNQPIGLEIRSLSNLLKRYVDNSATKKYVDKLTGTHSWIIGYLFENREKDIFQRDLETEFSIRRSTATGILQLMEKNKLIIKSPVDYDARLKKITLTPRAIEIQQIIAEDIKRIEAQLSKGLTEEEISVFFTVVSKIKNNINNNQ